MFMLKNLRSNSLRSKTILSVTIFCGIFGVLTLFSNFVPAQTLPPSTEFDKYLQQKDNSYQWKIVKKITKKSTMLEMTSQTWHGISWKHHVLVILPENITFTDFALLYIGGGTTGKEPDKIDIIMAQLLAAKTSMPVVILFQVPNQPLDPNNKGTGFREDALIGETLLKTLETKDPTWVLLLPMTKSVIRAMDTAQQFIKQEFKYDIEHFIVGGASKRGWTTWLAGASKDPRISALIPIVYNNLNLLKQFEGHIETWGDFSPQIHDYTDRGLFKKNEIPPPFKMQILNMIDPYTYLSRVTVPKLLIHGSNDPYWPVNATDYYWNDMQGYNYLLTLPNEKHELDKGKSFLKLIDSASVFTQQIASGGDLPKFDWTLTEKDSQYQIDIETEIPEPKKILWTAVSDSKNFQSAKWKDTPVENDIITVKKPATGHIAFFVELVSQQNGNSFSVTTQVWRF
ncbi:MAG: PhoPQ-activated pathogenicity-related family protein [Planctomycetaceae bacterium]|jgi:PhoPQ-activated pathogenicity-related protein|nr:PhoPQ-activated pathogenicity-related family protein [Planctomycetaceae bacterium]